MESRNINFSEKEKAFSMFGWTNKRYKGDCKKFCVN